VDWWTLVPVVIGGLLTAGGGWFGQWLSAKREHDTWARNLRQQAHAQFLLEFGRVHEAALLSKGAQSRGEAGSDRASLPTRMLALESQVTMLELLADRASYEKARALSLELHSYAAGISEGKDLSQLLTQYVSAVRAEFHLGPLAPRATWLPGG